jgi:hypothetical protein
LHFVSVSGVAHSSKILTEKLNSRQLPWAVSKDSALSLNLYLQNTEQTFPGRVFVD